MYSGGLNLFSSYVDLSVCVCVCVCVCTPSPPQVSGVLSELHQRVRERVRRACEDTLTQEGFVPDPLEEEMEGKWERGSEGEREGGD